MSRRRILVCALVPVCLTVLTVFSFVRGRADRRVAAKSETTKAAALAAVQTPPRLEAERVTLRPAGFEPEEITRPAGRFLLAVNDRSGEDGVVLLLRREGGEQLHTVRMRDNPRKHEWRRVVNLPAGRYLLKEATHPEWTCRITLIGP